MIWQHHFIQVGIESNPYLNLIIIGVFLFGSLHGIISIVALGNEGKALAALREAYDDAVRSRELSAMDPLWREKRCFQPAIVFKRPRLLDSVYDLALDEIRRARTMRLSVETMQTLLHTVDRRIVTDRALLGYLSGLCIFLGLIGTFIGLMEMVGSVGSIIGGVASADSGSPEAIKGLIRDLEAPLKGMATGFSASLFGLFASLVLGLTARFSTQATNGLRNELEAWLGAMSRIESEREKDDPALVSGNDPVARFGGVALSVMGGMQKTGQLVGRAADAIRLLADRQSEQGVVLNQLFGQLGTIARQNENLRETLERTSALQQAVVETRSDIRLGFEGVAQRIDGAASRLAEVTAEGSGQIISLVGQVAERQTEGFRHALATAQATDDGMRRIVVTQAEAMAEQQRALSVVGTSLADMRADIAAVGGKTSALVTGVGEAVAALGRTTDAYADRQQRDTALLVAGVQNLDLRLSEQTNQRVAGEQAVQAGLARLAGAVGETAGTINGRLDRQAEESRDIVARVSSLRDLVQTLSTVLDANVSRQAGDSAEASVAQNAALDRLAQHQADIARVLVTVAHSLESQSRGLDADLRDAIGEGFGQLSGALVQSQAAMARAMTDGLAASSAQAGLSDLAGTMRAELRDLRRTLETALVSGFDDVRQSMTQTLDSLGQLQQTDEQPEGTGPSFAEVPDEDPSHSPRDIAALLRMASGAANMR